MQGLTRSILWYLVSVVCVSYSIPQDYVDPQSTGGQDKDSPGSCTCMPYHRCYKKSTQRTIETTAKNENAENFIDIKISPEESECEHYLDRCCFPMDTETDNTRSTQRVPTQCGARQPDGVGFRISGEDEANYGEFPWMVAIIRRDRKGMECGGSIIHPQVILTAAHCVRGRKGLFIRAGEWDTQTENEMFPTQDRDVKTVIIHENYYAGGLHNDIALLVLAKPLELNDVVGTLCLPEQDEDMVGRTCVVSGWGKDVFGKEGKYQVILKRIEQPVVAKEPCQEALRRTRLGPRFNLHESFLCAGGEVGKDTCKGDGGGPLACPGVKDRSVYVQAGIVSWGIGCGTETPAVYVNVAHFRKWIDKKIDSLNLK